jgi:ribosome-associated protein
MLAKRIAHLMLSKKAHDIVILDLKKLTSATDHFVICSADSDTQVRAIADAVDAQGRDVGIAPWHMEGFQASTWIIIDYVDVVVHVFHREARAHYNLERLWSDAKISSVEDKLEVVVPKKTRAVPRKSSRTSHKRTRTK